MNQRQSFPQPDGARSRRFELSLQISDDQLERMTVGELLELASAEPPEPPREDLIDFARWLYESRRSRDRRLGGSLLGEPVWDMLLALYCLPPRGEPLCVSSLCYAAAVPQTTALRWVRLMEQKGLVERSRDAKDARRTYVSLSDDGDGVMTALLRDQFAARPR